ncbi:putative phospholipid-transporting ATPase VD [Merluccius polli]|uniref:Phospholipid-transporting ATPase VD n=1 Tax=Merluccius polli TaxID=89951 RepID=A0AA47P4R2_MERPO|nr:putative phospholipid-transporting ATPase VD [Merluccius polli]
MGTYAILINEALIFLSAGKQKNELHPSTKHTGIVLTLISIFTVLYDNPDLVANLYFLFLVLLNWVPAVEAFQKEITMVPLVVVLIVIAFKDALEDYRRYLFDKKVNDNLVRIYSSKQNAYIDQHWQDVRVGDFIRLSCNEIIPADVLLLYSSDPRGICYIETANLDGETNLKQRQVVTDLPLHLFFHKVQKAVASFSCTFTRPLIGRGPGLKPRPTAQTYDRRGGSPFSSQLGSELTPESFYCRIECENPNYNLGRFRGYMEHSNKVRVGLHNNNLLLRSCTVRNTDTIVGIVIYAGHETKAMKNNSGPRYKQSRLERRLNMDVLWCVLLLFAMCLTAAIGHGLWLKRWIDPIYSIAEQISPTLAGFYVFWTMIIVLQVLIPISLYVSIEIVKLGQIYFIQNDLALYNEQLDSGIQCRALNITEDLGQIQFLFSDKTGTLTENKMVFQCCTIYGVQYPHKENVTTIVTIIAEQISPTLAGFYVFWTMIIVLQVVIDVLVAIMDNTRRLALYEEEEEAGVPGRSLTLRSGCSSLSCRSMSCNRSAASLHTLTRDSEEGRGTTQPTCAAKPKEVIPDPELVKKMMNCLRRLAPVELCPSVELTSIVDFFLALAICNSVVVSSSSQPCHTGHSADQFHLQSLGSRCKSGSFHKPPHNRPLAAWHEKAKAGQDTSNVGLTNPSDQTTDVLQDKGTQDDYCGDDNAPHGRAETLGVSRRALEDWASGLYESRQMVTDDQLVYEAESPDEAALVHAAQAYHCTLRGRSVGGLTVDLLGTAGCLDIHLLHVLPFDATRKRMSVVVRHPLTGQVGVRQRSRLAPAGEGYSNIREQTQKHLDNYARDGLRTLCIAKKVMLVNNG